MRAVCRIPTGTLYSAHVQTAMYSRPRKFWARLLCHAGEHTRGVGHGAVDLPLLDGLAAHLAYVCVAVPPLRPEGLRFDILFPHKKKCHLTVLWATLRFNTNTNHVSLITFLSSSTSSEAPFSLSLRFTAGVECVLLAHAGAYAWFGMRASRYPVHSRSAGGESPPVGSRPWSKPPPDAVFSLLFICSFCLCM